MIFEGYQQTYGVGMPIMLTFSHPVVNKAAVERSLQLRTSKPVAGAWYWDGSQTLDFRPESYWPAHTQVSFTGHLNGVEMAPGVYGAHTLDAIVQYRRLADRGGQHVNALHEAVPEREAAGPLADQHRAAR